ncbi:MAG: MATE family efflux transporter [Bacteroidales bacterium]|nr:MATE family efflux transporter [Bacteroidales bacterium]
MKALDREILRLALPSILANITVPLVGLVDTAVAGHLHSVAGSSAEFIGGISVVALILNVIYWNFGFLRVSTGGLTAQAFGKSRRILPSEDLSTPGKGQGEGPVACDGRGRSERSERSSEEGSILWRALKLALTISAILLVLGWPLSKLSLLFRSATPGVAILAAQYILIRIWAAPATLSLMALKGWFIGMQDSFSSMITDLTVNLVNIAASIILTLGIGGWQGLGFPGIALGTVIAQWTGFILALAICHFRYRIRVCSGKWPKMGTSTPKNGVLFRKTAENGNKSFFQINADLFVRSLCMTGIYFGYTVLASRSGDILLACANIMMNLLMIFSYFTDGFAYAGEALTGRFIGENNGGMLRAAVRGTFRWSFGVAGIWMLIYWLAGLPLLHLMTDDAVVVDACQQFLPWLVVMPLTGCAAFTWDGIYIGATASKGIRNSMIWAVVAFFAVWFAGRVLPTAGAGAIHLLLGAYFAHLTVRAIYLSIKYKRMIYL